MMKHGKNLTRHLWYVWQFSWDKLELK